MHIKQTPAEPKHTLFVHLLPGEVFSTYCSDDVLSDELFIRSTACGKDDTKNVATRLRDGQIICHPLDCKVVLWDGAYSGRPQRY